MTRRPGAVGLVAAALFLVAACGGGGGPAAAPQSSRSGTPGSGSGASASGTPAPASSAPASPAPAASGPYVALGDSYTSGPNVPPQTGTPAGCARSGANYPALVAAGLHLAGADFRDVSCSGARTTDLESAQRTADGTNPPQLDALGPGTRLVTLGIGGNDAGVMDVLARCAVAGLRGTLLGAGRADEGCRSAYAADGGGPDDVQRRVDAAGDGVAAVLAEIRRRAPRAAVYVVGYPSLLPADPAGCAASAGAAFTPGDTVFLREKQQQLDAVLRERAAAAGAEFVDTAAASAGHDMCAGESERWVEPFLPAPGAAPLHPNAQGERGMADAVLAALRH